MFARGWRFLIAIFGLAVLCSIPARAGQIEAAAQQCTGRQVVTFLGSSTAAAQTTIAAIACATVRVRGLTARTPIRVKLLDATTFHTTILAIIKAEVAAQSLDGTTLMLRLLGTLDVKEDLAAVRRSNYSADTNAQYDPLSKTLYVLLPGKGGYTALDRAILAHEYTSALQDQYFNLGALLSDPNQSSGHNSDAWLARQALVEGDEFSTMLNVAAATFTRQELLQFNQQLQKSGTGGANVEHDFVHDQIGFPAANGTNFVKYITGAAALGKRGSAAQNAANTAINKALSAPPTSTDEVLNPALYVRHTGPHQVIAAPGQGLNSGWSRIDSDVLGTFGIGDLLNTKAGAPQAAQAAAQWQGDRWSVYKQGNDTAFFWHARFSSAAGAQAFTQAIIAYTAARFHAAFGTQGDMAWHTNHYAMAVRHHGNDAAMAISSNESQLNMLTQWLSAQGFPS